jgi:hypothetical protein
MVAVVAVVVVAVAEAAAEIVTSTHKSSDRL